MNTLHTPPLCFVPIPDPSDQDLLDELDSLVDKASQGDTRAVGAIAIAFGPLLLAEAYDVLSEDWSHLASDVLQGFFLALCDGSLTFPHVRGAALPWMTRQVRSRAHEHRRLCVPPDEVAE